METLRNFERDTNVHLLGVSQPGSVLYLEGRIFFSHKKFCFSQPFYLIILGRLPATFSFQSHSTMIVPWKTMTFIIKKRTPNNLNLFIIIIISFLNKLKTYFFVFSEERLKVVTLVFHPGDKSIGYVVIIQSFFKRGKCL